jgi:hypothetical protein
MIELVRVARSYLVVRLRENKVRRISSAQMRKVAAVIPLTEAEFQSRNFE